jgi:hypothetical protein
MIKQIVLMNTISSPFLSAQAVSVALAAPRPGGSPFRAGSHTSSIAGGGSLPLARSWFFHSSRARSCRLRAHRTRSLAARAREAR